jgi:transposase
MRRQYTEEERAQLIAIVLADGVPVPEAAAKLRVHESTAYNWIQRAKEQASARKALPLAKKGEPQAITPRFVQVVRASRGTPAMASTSASGNPAALEVHVAGVLIRVVSGFDAALLRAVLDALRGGAS